MAEYDGAIGLLWLILIIGLISFISGRAKNFLKETKNDGWYIFWSSEQSGAIILSFIFILIGFVLAASSAPSGISNIDFLMFVLKWTHFSGSLFFYLGVIFFLLSWFGVFSNFLPSDYEYDNDEGTDDFVGIDDYVGIRYSDNFFTDGYLAYLKDNIKKNKILIEESIKTADETTENLLMRSAKILDWLDDDLGNNYKGNPFYEDKRLMVNKHTLIREKSLYQEIKQIKSYTKEYDRWGMEIDRKKKEFLIKDYVFDENERTQFETDLQKCSDHLIDLQEQLKINDKSIKKEGLNKEIEITTQKIKDIRKTIRRADKVIKIQTERPNLTTGQFFIWSIFLTITRSIVIICGVFVFILSLFLIKSIFARVRKHAQRNW